MIIFVRTIVDKKIVIAIESSLYCEKKELLDMLFITFSIDNNMYYCPENAIYLHCKKDTFSESLKDESKWYIDFCNKNWYILLIHVLEDFFIRILQCTVIHGACIELYQKSILLIGKRKSGKTSLTKFFVDKKNAKYFDEDVVFLYKNKFYGFNLPLCLRYFDGDMNYYLEQSDMDQEKRYIYILKDGLINELSNIDIVFFVKYDKTCPKSVANLTRINMLNLIIQNLRGALDIKSVYSDLNIYFRKVKGFRLNYGSSIEAHQIIKEIIDNE